MNNFPKGYIKEMCYPFGRLFCRTWTYKDTAERFVPLPR